MVPAEGRSAMSRTSTLWPAVSYDRWRGTCDTLHAHTQLLGKLVVPVVETSGVQRPDGRVGEVEAAGAVEGFFGGAGG